MIPFPMQFEYTAFDADIYFVAALQPLASQPIVGKVAPLSAQHLDDPIRETGKLLQKFLTGEKTKNK